MPFPGDRSPHGRWGTREPLHTGGPQSTGPTAAGRLYDEDVRSVSPEWTPAEQRYWDDGLDRLLAEMRQPERPTRGGVTELGTAYARAWLSFGQAVVPPLVALNRSAAQQARSALARSWEALRVRVAVALTDWIERHIP